MKVLVTGAAGFIGFHVCRKLCEIGVTVVGIDNLNDYYNVALKKARLDQLLPFKGFSFVKLDVSMSDELLNLFKLEKFDRVVHLAAQAGVRYSIDNPQAYVESNLVGFANVLEGCRQNSVGHLVYASSSSVYGANQSIPFKETDNVDHPMSFYAATKKANEAMAHSYSSLYGIPISGLRFFTVYGPWGRPDMSPILFANAIHEGKSLQVFNYGKHRRDFTYIDDIVSGVIKVLDNVTVSDVGWDAVKPSPSRSYAPWRIYNIGNSQPVELLYYIECIEKEMGKTTEKTLLPMQPGDVEDTYADVSTIMHEVGYSPNTSIEEGVKKFVEWYKEYRHLCLAS